MAKMDLNKFNSRAVVASIIKNSLPILFTLSLLVMWYLSFVDSARLSPSVRNITLFGLVGAALSYLVWVNAYKKMYDQILNEDLANTTYCIHKRYYLARKGWASGDLQKALEKAKADFRNAWLSDVQEITQRTIEEIEAQPYKGKQYKMLIWRIKHKKYPQYGVQYTRQLLSVLDVSASGAMNIHIKSAESYFMKNAIQKIFMNLLALGMSAAIVIDLLDGDIWSALLKLGIATVTLFMSLLFGSVNGNIGARKKLAVAQEVSELLEEWKGAKPETEPFGVTSEDKKEVAKEPVIEVI